VSADDKTRAYGQNNPTLTASYSGFVGGETLATSGVTGEPALSTTAVVDSPAGNYSIAIADGSLSSDNYRFTFVDGSLVVFGTAPVILSITVEDPTHVVIQWTSINNVTYRLQYRADFNQDWADLAPDVTAVSDTTSIVDNPSGATLRFYRIMVVP